MAEYQFRIEAYTPTSFPMNHLAEYLADLARLLGEHRSVHFAGLTEGSTNVSVVIEPEAEPKVKERIRTARNPNGQVNDANVAWRSLNRRLAKDNASGSFHTPNGRKIIDFPGKKRFNQPEFGPFNELGTFDGKPIRVGGEKQVVPVHLEDLEGKIRQCHASRAIAHEIAQHIFTTILRVTGTARWFRDADGEWILKSFTIQQFTTLDESPLTTRVDRLRHVHSPLSDAQQAFAILRELRQG